MVGAWLSVSVVGLIVVCGFLVFWLQVAIEAFDVFHHSVFIICVLLWYFTDEVEEQYADRTYICNFQPHQNYRWGSGRVKLGLSTQFRTTQWVSYWPFPGGTSAKVLCLCFCDFICGVCLFHYLFLISPSFDASGGLCFVVVAFPGISLHSF